MLFSTFLEYSIRGLCRIAADGHGRPMPARLVARAEGIPEPFLSKILSRLAHLGFVHAVRGPGGGFRLARPAHEIRMGDVIEATDGLAQVRKRCVLGLEECRDDRPCAVHDEWGAARDAFLASVEDLRLSELARRGLRPPAP